MTDEYGRLKLPTAKTDKLTGLPLRDKSRRFLNDMEIESIARSMDADRQYSVDVYVDSISISLRNLLDLSRRTPISFFCFCSLTRALNFSLFIKTSLKCKKGVHKSQMKLVYALFCVWIRTVPIRNSGSRQRRMRLQNWSNLQSWANSPGRSTCLMQVLRVLPNRSAADSDHPSLHRRPKHSQYRQ